MDFDDDGKSECVGLSVSEISVFTSENRQEQASSPNHDDFVTNFELQSFQLLERIL